MGGQDKCVPCNFSISPGKKVEPTVNASLRDQWSEKLAAKIT